MLWLSKEETAVISIVLPFRLPCAGSLCCPSKEFASKKAREEILRWTVKFAHFIVHLPKNFFLFFDAKVAQSIFL